MADRFGGIWRELRRRHVVSTVAAYAAVGFVLLQLGEILFPAFGFDDQATRALVALLISGFPVVVALSWIFDMTRTGLRRTATDDELDEVRERQEGFPVVLAAGVLVSAAALGFVGWYAVLAVEPLESGPTAASIAVLPFSDLSAGGDQGYLADGISEEILNVLARVPSLQVAARTSSFSFRNSEVDIPEIGRQLGVRHVLEGSVRRVGDQVRVTAQLIEAASGFHLWSDNFDRRVEDLFAVQDEIAQSIAQELVGRLDVGPDPGERRAVPEEARTAYWRGREEWNRRGPVGVPRAIALFDEAVRLHPEYAEALAGLADSWALLPQVSSATDPTDAFARAEAYARSALDIDSTLAEAHASLGLVLALRGDRAGALESLGHAIRLNPSYAPAHHWRGNVLAEMGQMIAALDDVDRAARLDPLSVAIATDHANVLLWSGDFDAALAEYERALDLSFSYAPAQLGVALVELARGDAIGVHQAMAQWAAVVRAPLDLASALAPAMLAYRGTGQAGAPPAGLRTLAEEDVVSAGTLASLHALVGDREGTLVWLAAAVEDGSWVEQYPAVNTAYAPFREDERFRSIVERTRGVSSSVVE